MSQLLTQIGLAALIIAMVCTQIFLLCKYFVVRRTLWRMEGTSSGDHFRYKNGRHSHRQNGNGK